MASTIAAMFVNLKTFAPGGASDDTLLFAVGGALMVLGVWLLVEAVLALRRSTSS